MSALLALAVLLAAAPAAAHTAGARSAAAAPGWHEGAWMVAPLALAALLYAAGLVRLWRRAGRGRGVRRWQAGCFAAGWTALSLALLSPLHGLAERLFLAHMVEHEILIAVAAPLLALGRPVAAFLWAVPRAWRDALGAAARRRGWLAVWRAATAPTVAAAVHGAALWAWHAPPLFAAALADGAVHALQHASFLGTGLLFWWSLLGARTARRAYGPGALLLFLTALHSSVLGALLTLSPRLWYPGQAGLAARYGLSALEDQQLAGLVMWVPGGLVYAGAALALAGLWVAGAAAGGRPRHALAR